MRKIVLILFIIMTSCNVGNQKVEKPKKLKSVPEKAFWIGGVDGGNWYYIEYIHPHKNSAKISIYNDQSGELIVSKKFILVCESQNQTFIKNLETQIDSFDGNRIYLTSENDKQKCYLQ
ncbi:MAG: hypothetical protein ACOVOQ_14630 [Flavobacterium sp.]